MFKIGEFSKLTKVSVRMLRYYDELGLLKPAQIDKFTGYRLYSIEQIPVLQKIILLRDMDFNVTEIACTLNHWKKDFVITQLNNKKLEIQQTIQLEQERISKIEMAIKDIKDEKIEIHCNIAIKTIPSYKILSLRKIIPSYYSEIILWNELLDFVKRERIDYISDLAIYHDETPKDFNVDVEVGVIVNKLGNNKDGFIYRETEAIETMACFMVYGPYKNISKGYESLAVWLEKHQQYKLVGLSRIICHKGEADNCSPNEYLTEIQIPVVKQSCYILK